MPSGAMTRKGKSTLRKKIITETSRSLGETKGREKKVRREKRKLKDAGKPDENSMVPISLSIIG